MSLLKKQQLFIMKTTFLCSYDNIFSHPSIHIYNMHFFFVSLKLFFKTIIQELTFMHTCNDQTLSNILSATELQWWPRPLFLSLSPDWFPGSGSCVAVMSGIQTLDFAPTLNLYVRKQILITKVLWPFNDISFNYSN